MSVSLAKTWKNARQGPRHEFENPKKVLRRPMKSLETPEHASGGISFNDYRIDLNTIACIEITYFRFHNKIVCRFN